MKEYIIELSKYVLPLCMVMYTLECCLIFIFRDEEGRKGIYLRQNLWMFVMQLFCFADLALVSRKVQYVFFYAFVQVFLFAVLIFSRRIYQKINRFLLNNMCMLLGIGLCMIARLSFQKALKQYVIVLFSLVIGLSIPFLLNKITFWKKITWLYGAVGLGLLSTVLILGEVTHGSKISFSIAGVTFQPSEFVKIIFIFCLAGALWEETSLRRVAITTAVAGAHVLVLVLSKDLGSALIFFMGFLLILLAATHNYWYLLAGIGGGSLAAYLAYHIFDHVKVRVLAWQDPWAYIDREGYQITQSLFAVGSGSWFGMGLMKGNPKAIPFVDADFIFSSICEELGVIFGICLILVCISCFVMIMDISVKVKDKFYQMITFGLGIMYIFQIFLTIGGGIKFIPLTGVTLPFISYGGSSVLTTVMMFFIIQGIYIRMQKEGERRLVRRRKAEGKAVPEENSSDRSSQGQQSEEVGENQ